VLLTGKTPVDAFKRKVDNARLVAPKEYNAQISDRTNRAILTGMKLDPKERSLSMREWLDSLGLTAEKNSQPSVFVPSNTKSNWERKIQFWGVVIAAIAAAVETVLAGIAP
jgi:eukaryotic-like serine/threonine-protein kinase